MLELIPWLIAMAVLIAFSAFFSASEAALFSLRPADRRILALGSTAQKTAARLLKDPERVLSAVLFWNLVVNIVYFALASIVEHRLPDGSALVWPLRIAALLMIIFCSEMLPKTFAVLLARELSATLAVPLSFLVSLVDPIMPMFRFIMLLSRRLLWPNFKDEETLETSDLERAIELSTDDAKLLAQEQTVLRNIVMLSDLRADEAMRPRRQLNLFVPPVSIADLEGSLPSSGYLFLAESESGDITHTVRLDSLWSIHPEHLESTADPVVYVPWCSSLADTAGLLLAKEREVAIVVDEWGASVGAVTINDIMDVVFTDKSSRSERLLNVQPIQQVEEGLWTATGITNLRRVAEYFEVTLPSSRSKTIAGAIQESLQKMPIAGDECDWGPFRFRINDVDEMGRLSLEIRKTGGDAES